MPALTVYGKQSSVVDCFNYPESLIRTVFGVAKISSQVLRTKTAFAKLQHLRRCIDTWISVKISLCSATVRNVLVYGCESSVAFFCTIDVPEAPL